jgi:hypothetical protein
MIRSIVGSALCVLLAGCASVAAPTLESDDVSRIKTVGVVSFLGDSFFHVDNNGPFIFNFHVTPLQEADWHIDDLAERAAVDALERGARYRPIRIQHTSLNVEKVYSRKPVNPIDFDALGSELRPLVAAQPVDALLVITRYPLPDAIGHTKLKYEGVGIYQMWAPLLGPGTVAPFAWYSLHVINGATLKVMASRISVIPDDPQLIENYSTELPFKRINVSHYRDDPAKVTDEDKRVIREALTEVITASMAFTIEQIGFVSKQSLERADAAKLGQAFIASRYDDFDPSNMPITVRDAADNWAVTYKFPQGTVLGGVPVVLIDKRSKQVVKSYRAE